MCHEDKLTFVRNYRRDEGWWFNKGKQYYPNATSILVLADGGGSNSSRFYVFKEALQNVVNEIGVEIRIAHYPPYTSKWNLIEHRLFSNVTRAMEGVVLKNHKHVKDLYQSAKNLMPFYPFISWNWY